MKPFIISLLVLITISCSSPRYHGAEKAADRLELYPDYADIIIPCNIAPINFDVLSVADRCYVEMSGGDKTFILRGPKVRIPERIWHKILAEAKGSRISFKIFVKRDDKWLQYDPFTCTVAQESIDNYLTYRLIEPGYSNYGYLVLRQRDLSSFKERDLYNNALISERVEQQCINCHSFRNYNPDTFQFHARHTDGGTIIVTGGKGTKIKFMTGDMISNPVYPSWHPQENLIAYSLNSTSQLFIAKGNQKVEVYDTKSDLVLYDVYTEETGYIVRDSLSLETFPYWSADGKTLFYASAYLPDFGAGPSTDLSMITEKIRYNIWSIGFNPQTREFGTPTLVFDAESDSLSAVTPRPSPDGRYLLSGVGSYGSFHVWHESGDIYLTDLTTGITRPLDEINSPRAESFKSWSSNSRWIAFTSRRDDGSYTRIYLAYFDLEGNAHKPFLLPQRDPDQNHRLFKSYNVPEFTTDKSSWTPKRIEMIIHSDPHQATLIR